MAVISRSTAVIIGPKGDPGPAGPAGAALGFPSQTADTVATPSAGQTGFFDTSNSSQPTTKDSTGRLRQLAYQLYINVTDPAYGAKGDGIADDTAAIQAAFTAKDAAGGGVIFLPVGQYKVTSVVTTGSAPFEMRGCGFRVLTSSPGSWATNVEGSVIICSGAGGLSVTTDSMNGARFCNFALVGGGSGTGLLLQDPGPDSAVCEIDKVLAANWGIGVALNNFEDAVLNQLWVWSCVTGLQLGRVTVGGVYAYCTDVRIRDININSCGKGVVVLGAQHVDIKGGVAQGCTSGGISLEPELTLAAGPGTVQGVFVDGMWWENHAAGGCGLRVDSTNGNIESVHLDNMHTDAAPFIFPSANNVISGLYLGPGFVQVGSGSSITIPSNVNDFNSESQAFPLGLVIHSTDAYVPFDGGGLINFTSTVDTAEVITGYGDNFPPNIVLEISVDALATRSTVNSAASWRGLRATYQTDGSSVLSVVGSEIGTVGPTVASSGEGAGYRLLFAQSGNAVFVRAVSGVVQSVDWRVLVNIVQVG